MTSKPVKVMIKPSQSGRTKVEVKQPRQSVSRKIAARNSKKATVVSPAKAGRAK